MNPYRQRKLDPPYDHPCNRSGCPEVLGSLMWFCRKDWNRVPSKLQEELNVAYGIAKEERNFKHPRYLAALKLARAAAEGAEERSVLFHSRETEAV